MPNSDLKGRQEAAATETVASSPETKHTRTKKRALQPQHNVKNPTTTPGKTKNPYAAILRLPGTAKFSAAATLARLPMSMVGLAIVLIVEHSYGTYAAGGRVTAAYLIAAAIATPILARLIDRRGQSAIMRPIVVINAVLMVALGIAVTNQAPEPALWALAVGVGATIGSFGALVRKRWTYTLDSPQHLHTAFSLESALDEFIFVIGPTLATVLVTQVWPLSGLLVPAAGALIGGLWFCAQRSTEPPPEPTLKHNKVEQASLLNKPLIALSLIFLFIGTVFGSVEVSTVAFAKEADQEHLSGLVLAVFAIGSMVAGLAYGARHWRSSLVRRLCITVTVLAIGISTVLVANNLWQLTVILLVTGLAIAPTLITGNNIIQHVAANSRLTEALAWASTAMTIGVSIGTAIAGDRIDVMGAHGGFLVATCGAGLALVMTYAAAATFARKERA